MDVPSIFLGIAIGVLFGLSPMWINFKGYLTEAKMKVFFDKIGKILQKKTEKDKTKEIEKPRVRDKADVWLESNTYVFSDRLESIVEIYRDGQLPFPEELAALTEENLRILYQKGAFKFGEPEKQRVFNAYLKKVKTYSDLLNFYYRWAASGREEEASIASRIINSIRKWSAEDVENFDIREVTPEGKLYKFLELSRVTFKNQVPQQPFIVKRILPNKDDAKEEKIG